MCVSQCLRRASGPEKKIFFSSVFYTFLIVFRINLLKVFLSVLGKLEMFILYTFKIIKNRMFVDEFRA